MMISKNPAGGFGNKSRSVVRIMRNGIMDRLNNSATNSIEVMSAFNGFGIYNTDRFKGFSYDGIYSTFKTLITDEERENTIHVLKEHGLQISDLRNTQQNQCCEHLFYHINAFRQGRKIKISKFMVAN
jgi:hypothetical protein